jgi:hypothetical protein
MFAKNRVENFLIDRIQDRFEPAGSNPYAQKSPDGRFWRQRAAATILYRKNPNRRQALFESGSLRDSIGIVRGGLAIEGALSRGVATQVRTATVGIRPGYVNEKGNNLQIVGAFLQSGGTTPNNADVPGRVFIGVSGRDSKELENTLQRIINKSVR